MCLCALDWLTIDMVNSFSLSLICSGQGYASQLQAKPRLGERYVKVTLTTANSTGFHCFSSTKVDFCVEKMFYEPFWVRTSVLILTIHTVVLSAPQTSAIQSCVPSLPEMTGLEIILLIYSHISTCDWFVFARACNRCCSLANRNYKCNKTQHGDFKRLTDIQNNYSKSWRQNNC